MPPLEINTNINKTFPSHSNSKMPKCIVLGCKNCSQRSDGSISFHRIPTNNKIKDQWLKRIPRVNPRSPAYSYVCSPHFTSDCFRSSPHDRADWAKATTKATQGINSVDISIVFANTISYTRRKLQSAAGSSGGQ